MKNSVIELLVILIAAMLAWLLKDIFQIIEIASMIFKIIAAFSVIVFYDKFK